MANSGVCPVCDRRVRQRKDGSGLRTLHYINETRWWSYELKPCRGSTTDGSVPSPMTIADGKKTKIRCPCCNRRVRETDDFRPRKHIGPDGKKDCAGWRANKRIQR